MKHLTTAITILVLFIFPSEAQVIPEGYILQYEQNFSNSSAIGDFRFSHPSSWEIARTSNNYYLRFNKDTSYVPAVASPGTICILDNFIFGDFIMEVDIMPLNSGDSLREICILAAVRDSLQYYYIQLASVTDSISNGIFLVNRTTNRKIISSEPEPIAWMENKWHHLRIERDIVKRTFTVYDNDMADPVMESHDYQLVMGYVGFGGFSGSGGIDNIRIWAPTSIPEECPVFEK